MLLVKKIKTLAKYFRNKFCKEKIRVAFTYEQIAIYKDDNVHISGTPPEIFAQWELIVMQQAGMSLDKQFKEGTYKLITDNVDVIDTLDLK